LLAASAAAAAPMSRDAFTQEFVARAKQQVPDVQLEVIGPLQLHSKDVNGLEVTISLDNAYTQYSADPSTLQTVLTDHITGLLSKPDFSAEKGDASIRAIVKPMDYLAAVTKQLAPGGPGNEVIFERLNEDLVMVYVFDSETAMRLVMKKDLEKRKMGKDALHAIAVKNLADFFEGHVSFEPFANTGAAKIYGVTLDRNYEASTLLLAKYWNKQTFDVSGDIVVFVPARDTVLVTGSKDAEGLRIAARVANQAFQEMAYSISPAAYVYRAGKWQRYKP
jgi:hypothetical protein